MTGLQTSMACMLCVTLMAVCGAQAGNHLPANPFDRLWEEIGNVKTMMSYISDELGRFNSLYLGKLEHRMVNIATALSSVDSNVKNLQERAHVWDTFQLHVAAWNDQISTLDKKVDILSRGQEKMELMDGKLNFLQNLDYKVERVVGKIDETDNKLSAIGKSMENHRDSPLFSDVATRGVLSTLRIIERKLDRLNLGMNQHHSNTGRIPGGRQPSYGRPGGRKDDTPLSEGEELVAGRGRLVIKCNTPVIVEELLRDVASKVDVIFDKVSASQDRDAVEQVEEHHANELRELSENKLLDRLWKRLTQPYKKTTRALEALENSVRTMSNASAAMWEDQVAVSDQLLTCCMDGAKRLRAFTTDADVLMKRVENSVVNVAFQEERRLASIDTGFRRLDAVCSAPRTCVGEGRDECVGRDTGRNREDRINVGGGIRNDSKDDEGSNGGISRNSGGNTDTGREGQVGVWGGTRDGSGRDINTEVGSGDDELSPGDEEVEPPFIPMIVVSNVRSCDELIGTDIGKESRVYQLGDNEINSEGRDFYKRYCDMHTDGGGWTVIQRRGHFEPRRNFSVSWDDYKHGFGDLDKDFWFGNDFIHRLTTEKEMVLRVELEAFDGTTAWADYSHFKVGSLENLYQLTISGYLGNASDSFSAHNGFYFSTVDRNNDEAPPCCPCAPSYGGGWWFYSCFEANLNGNYYNKGEQRDEFRGLIWEHWLGDYSLRATQMKLRSKNLDIVGDPDFEDHSTTVAEDVDPLDIPEDP